MHGIKTNLLSSTSLTPATIASSVIGIVATGADADPAMFPLDTPRLITDVTAALAKAGTSGTLRDALAAIQGIVSPKIVVVRVAVDATDQDAKVLGTGSGAAYTGMQALLTAEAKTGVRPRILGAPGLDTEDVTNGLVAVAKRLRGFVYAMAEGATRDAAVTYANKFGERELMLIWPATSKGAADTIGCALGMRAYIDQTQGWQKTISNVVVNGITGLSVDVSWALDDDTTDAAVLNDANITTIIFANGARFWGNRTTSTDPDWQFESAVRSSQVLQDNFQTLMFPYIDKPITVGIITTLLKKLNGMGRKMVGNSQLIGFFAWYNSAKNSAADLAGGKLALDYKFTPCAPLEDLTENQTITDEFYSGIAGQLTTTTTAAAA